MAFNPKWIEGKTVARVDMRSGRSEGRLVQDPLITFTDGSSVSFYAQEGENEHGVGVRYHRSEKAG